MIIAKFVAVVIIGYLLGSIPFGLLIAKRRAKVDIREYGSGKTGSTNVLRVAGRKAAIMAVLLDIAKGSVAVLLARQIFGTSYLVFGDLGLGLLAAESMAALGAMAGHNWSIFLRFKGGRGVATFFGGLAALCPPVALFGGELMLLSASLTRFVSLGSIAGAVGAYAILMPLTLFNGFPIEYLIYTMVGSIAIIVMHKDNIARLLAGNERRLGEKVELKPAPVPEETM